MAGGQAMSLRSDTFQFRVSDSVMALDGGVFSNSLERLSLTMVRR